MSKTKWTLAEEEALMQIIGTKRSPSFTWNDLGKLNFLYFLKQNGTFTSDNLLRTTLAVE